jgi:hypothetical protein
MSKENLLSTRTALTEDTADDGRAAEPNQDVRIDDGTDEAESFGTV